MSMKFNTYLKLLAASFALGVGLSFVGCGKNDNGGNVQGVIPGYQISPYPSRNCAPGTFDTDGKSCVPGYSFADACLRTRDSIMNQGRLITVAGVETCKTVSAYGTMVFVSTGGVRTLTPSTPQNPSAFVAPFSVIPGDRLTVLSTPSGGFGYLSGGLFQSCKYRTKTDGYNTDVGNYVSNEGAPQGLFISDGVISQPAWSGSVVFNNSAALRIGFNTVDQYSGCSKAQLDFKIERCMTAGGVPIACQ